MNVSIPTLQLKDFDYDFPKDLIAQEPLAKRDQSRLLVRASTGDLQHLKFHQLPSVLKPGTLLVLNNTKVFAARLLGRTASGGKAELLLLEKIENPSRKNLWSAIGKPGKKLTVGAKIFFNAGVEAEIITKPTAEDGPEPFRVEINLEISAFDAWLDLNGYIPLPPYIQRLNPAVASTSNDVATYQTVYADERGSVAAPTAGLHFTDTLLSNLAKQEISHTFVTLHVGAGTFLPVKAEAISHHKMHQERYTVGTKAYQMITQALKENRPIVAVGTTSLRCLESFHQFQQLHGKNACDELLATELFIWPKSRSDRFKPWGLSGLLTNFHQPCSTLFMLICALIGFDEAHAMYRQAIERKYRLFSYGDACLLWL